MLTAEQFVAGMKRLNVKAFSGKTGESLTDAYATQPIPELSATDIPFYEAIRLVADCTGYRIEIRGKQVVLKECAGCELSRVFFGEL